jgi:hypothetical protein
MTLPVPVILNRLLWAFLVLEIPAFLDIGVGRIGDSRRDARDFSAGIKDEQTLTIIIYEKFTENEKYPLLKRL